MSEKVQNAPDISEYVRGICEALGVEPKNVARMIIRPTFASFEVFRLDENGSKYIEDETNEVALDEVEFKVKT